MLIKKVSNNKELASVVKLADIIWHEHFTPIIGDAQVDYMLQKFQSSKSITQQIHQGFIYFLMSENKIPIGYAALIIKDRELFLSKFYILLSARNKGFGRQFIVFLEQLACEQDIEKIALSVNKNNVNTIKAYQHMGFSNVGSVVQDIGHNFVMDDYKMEKKIMGR